jgi:hypothetical protein
MGGEIGGNEGGVFEAKGKKYIYKFFDQKRADLFLKQIPPTAETVSEINFAEAGGL